MRHDVLRRLLAGLAAGDSLGSTSEFTDPARMGDVCAAYGPLGWPFRQVGGGAFDLPPGHPTDDTDLAMCLVRSFLERGRFDGADVAARFVAWMRTDPRDIGGTTLRTLRAVAAGAPWHEGGLSEYRRNPHNAANGSLMRNGIVPALAEDLDDAFRVTLSHGVITHYAPLPVLCCAAQTWLLGELLGGRAPFERAWVDEFRARFTAWLDATDDAVCRRWRERVGDALPAAWRALAEADFDPDTFNPYAESYRGRMGYVLLTLQIGVWAAAWSLRGEPFPTPPGLPAEIFTRTGPWTLCWVAVIGADSDTYGATAGPLIAAAHGGLPEPLTDGLDAVRELDEWVRRGAGGR